MRRSVRMSRRSTAAIPVSLAPTTTTCRAGRGVGGGCRVGAHAWMGCTLVEARLGDAAAWVGMQACAGKVLGAAA